jgi:hypothetical protein
MQEEGKSDESRTRYCCDHGAECAVHQLPFDSEYARCTCPVGIGSVRHERIATSTNNASPIVDTLARTAQGALIALQSGESELAARLLSDVIDRAQRAEDGDAGGGGAPSR